MFKVLVKAQPVSQINVEQISKMHALSYQHKMKSHKAS